MYGSYADEEELKIEKRINSRYPDKRSLKLKSFLYQCARIS